MQHLEGSGTPVLYIGRTVLNQQHYTTPDDTMTQNDEWIEQTVHIGLVTLGRRTN